MLNDPRKNSENLPMFWIQGDFANRVKAFPLPVLQDEIEDLCDILQATRALNSSEHGEIGKRQRTLDSAVDRFFRVAGATDSDQIDFFDTQIFTRSSERSFDSLRSYIIQFSMPMHIETHQYAVPNDALVRTTQKDTTDRLLNAVRMPGMELLNSPCLVVAASASDSEITFLHMMCSQEAFEESLVHAKIAASELTRLNEPEEFGKFQGLSQSSWILSGVLSVVDQFKTEQKDNHAWSIFKVVPSKDLSNWSVVITRSCVTSEFQAVQEQAEVYEVKVLRGHYGFPIIQLLRDQKVSRDDRESAESL